MTAKYGVFDTVDQLWMGDESGPKLFDDEKIAMVAAQIVDVRLGHPPGRHQACLWLPAAITLRDTVPTRLDALEALTLLEEGKW
jgi:hypothetical protein